MGLDRGQIGNFKQLMILKHVAEYKLWQFENVLKDVATCLTEVWFCMRSVVVVGCHTSLYLVLLRPKHQCGCISFFSGRVMPQMHSDYSTHPHPSWGCSHFQEAWPDLPWDWPVTCNNPPTSWLLLWLAVWCGAQAQWEYLSVFSSSWIEPN